MRVLGVDLAAEAPNTGVVTLEVDSFGQVTLLPVGERASDDVLVALARDVDLVAVDAPLGWPVGFVASLTAHAMGNGWPAGADRRPLRHRRTDLVIQAATGLWPLSVSSDKLGVTAMRCAHLQQRWAEEVWSGTPAPRDGSGPLVEVYPAATLARAGRRFRGYKGPHGEQARQAILDAVAADGVDIQHLTDRALRSDHVLDAAVAALTGLDALRERTARPGPDDVDLARVEGWIHLPFGPSP